LQKITLLSKKVCTLRSLAKIKIRKKYILDKYLIVLTYPNLPRGEDLNQKIFIQFNLKIKPKKMNVALLYKAIEEQKLYHIISSKTENNKTFITFKRHHNTFTFICSPSKKDEGEYEYKLLKDGEKARFGTIKAMWDDYEEMNITK
jgi:hypothetical protein